jgi:hypothetical protein
MVDIDPFPSLTRNSCLSFAQDPFLKEIPGGKFDIFAFFAW